MKRKILITFNVEENTWLFERLEHCLEQKNSENAKIFCNKAQQENIHTDICLKVILQ